MDGVVIIDKPAGVTSHDVVSRVKRMLGAKKAGHTGTLDPMATGVLPVCLNEATKLARFLSDDSKEYSATMLLGVTTDTLDTEGKIIYQSDKVVPVEAIKAALAGMVGKIKQVPPAYSAIKHCGEPLYKWARKGIVIEAKPREVEIQHIIVEDILYPRVTFRVACSKGTYIRTLCADVGDLLGCGACLCGLRRLRSGFFSEDMAIPLGNSAHGEKGRELLEKMLPMTKLLPLLASVEIEDGFADRLRDGFQPSVETMKAHVLPFLETGDMVKFINSRGYLVAIAEMVTPVSNFSEIDEKSQAARIVRVFNNVQN
ncbi:MAG: tRNA pseudouridine(55) synthase TruB [Smithellaceae bacterium]